MQENPSHKQHEFHPSQPTSFKFDTNTKILSNTKHQTKAIKLHIWNSNSALGIFGSAILRLCCSNPLVQRPRDMWLHTWLSGCPFARLVAALAAERAAWPRKGKANETRRREIHLKKACKQTCRSHKKGKQHRSKATSIKCVHSVVSKNKKQLGVHAPIKLYKLYI